MSKSPKPSKPTVELQQPAAKPSRIRREPPPQPQTALARKLERIDWSSPEWEMRFAVAGIIFFAVAIAAVVFDVGHLLSY